MQPYFCVFIILAFHTNVYPLLLLLCEHFTKKKRKLLQQIFCVDWVTPISVGFRFPRGGFHFHSLCGWAGLFNYGVKALECLPGVEFAISSVPFENAFNSSRPLTSSAALSDSHTLIYSDNISEAFSCLYVHHDGLQKHPKATSDIVLNYIIAHFLWFFLPFTSSHPAILLFCFLKGFLLLYREAGYKYFMLLNQNES